MAVSQLTMKLVVDTNSKRVMFAEVGNECVDFLFHILALPIGSVVRLLTMKEMVGSLGNLYDSFENLDVKYIEPKQDKDILLKPKSATCNISSVTLFTNSPVIESQFYTCPYHNYYVTDDPSTTCPSMSQPINTNITFGHVSIDGPRQVMPLSVKFIRTGDRKSNKGKRRTEKNTKVEYFTPPAVNEVVTTSICGRLMDTNLDHFDEKI
uniref:DUF674 family protein n=1 Tax=Solanum tuberosum TaxID=4113 RepID=M1CK86_SOLTU